MIDTIKSTDQDKLGTSENKKKDMSTKKIDLKSTNVDWRPVHSVLNAEIKLRY